MSPEVCKQEPEPRTRATRQATNNKPGRKELRPPLSPASTHLYPQPDPVPSSPPVPTAINTASRTKPSTPPGKYQLPMLQNKLEALAARPSSPLAISPRPHWPGRRHPLRLPCLSSVYRVGGEGQHLSRKIIAEPPALYRPGSHRVSFPPPLSIPGRLHIRDWQKARGRPY